jgi:hypothetical protein
MTVEIRHPREIRCAAWLGLISLAVACSACQGISDRVLYGSGKNLDTELRALQQANRIAVIGRGSGSKPLATITDRATLRTVVTFFGQHPDGWFIFSGAGGDYDLYLYDDDRLLGRVGLTAGSKVGSEEDTLSFGDYFRRAPASEVATLMARLGLPWPPPR